MQIPGVFCICKRVTLWSLFLLHFSPLSFPLGRGAEVGRERERHGPKTPQSPSPFKWSCLWVCTPQTFSCSQNRETLNCLFLFVNFILISFSVGESLACPVPKKVISRYFCFDSDFVRTSIFFCAFSLYPFPLFFYTLKSHLQQCAEVFFVFGMNRTKYAERFVSLILFRALQQQTALQILCDSK